MRECGHQVADFAADVRRLRRIGPAVGHLRRDQHDLAGRKRLLRISGRPDAPPVRHAAELPGVVPVEFGLQRRRDALGDEKERMVVDFGQFVGYDGFFHMRNGNSCKYTTIIRYNCANI